MTATAPSGPDIYQLLLDIGWEWAATVDGLAHLVPPRGDRARCGAVVARHRRAPVEPTPANSCRRCRQGVGLP